MLKTIDDSTNLSDITDINSQSNDIEMANSIEALKTILFNTPEASHAKIQLIKEELEMGRYEINPHNIASKLLEYAPIIQEMEIA